MQEQDLYTLLQQRYFDNIDTANAAGAVEVFTPDAHWQHTQVWPHDGHNARKTDRLHGRDALLAFLTDRVVQMQRIQIRHCVDEVILGGNRGAFRARVEGPDGRSLGFLGWVELRDGLLQQYLVVPEDFAVDG